MITAETQGGPTLLETQLWQVTHGLYSQLNEATAAQTQVATLRNFRGENAEVFTDKDSELETKFIIQGKGELAQQTTLNIAFDDKGKNTVKSYELRPRPTEGKQRAIAHQIGSITTSFPDNL